MRNKRKMLWALASVTVSLAIGLALYAQNPGLFQGRSTLSRVAGVYDAKNYSYWSGVIDNSTSVPAASPATFVLRQGTVSLPDGRTIVPYFVGEIVNVGAGTTQEVVTLTAVSGCFLNAPVDSCTISGNTSNAHGRGDLITSGTAGIGEAVQDASNNGGNSVYWELDCGPVTLNTGGVTTTLTGVCARVPNTFTNLGASVFVNTTVTTSASYSVGITGATTAFMTSCTALTAGTNCGQFVNAPGQTKQGTGYSALLITANAAAGAGVIHPKVWGYVGAQSNF